MLRRGEEEESRENKCLVKCQVFLLLVSFCICGFTTVLYPSCDIITSVIVLYCGHPVFYNLIKGKRYLFSASLVTVQSFSYPPHLFCMPVCTMWPTGMSTSLLHIFWRNSTTSVPLDHRSILAKLE